MNTRSLCDEKCFEMESMTGIENDEEVEREKKWPLVCLKRASHRNNSAEPENFNQESMNRKMES